MKTFQDRGIVAAASTMPASLVNPMTGIQMMMTRTDRNGDAIFTEESVSLEDAIRAYTWNGTMHRRPSMRRARWTGQTGDVTIFRNRRRG